MEGDSVIEELDKFLNNLTTCSYEIEEDGDDIKIVFKNEVAKRFSSDNSQIDNLIAVNSKTVVLPIYNDFFAVVVGEQSYFNKIRHKRIKQGIQIIFLADNKYILKNRDTLTTNSKHKGIKHLPYHISQYLELFDLFDSDKKNGLVEYSLPSHDGIQLIVINKITYKTVSSVLFKNNCPNFLSLDFEDIQIDILREKIRIPEWLSCFKEELCKFADNQSISTFERLYQNINYLINISEKNYQLYITNFSFENVLNKYKEQKELYFTKLNSVKEKIANQIITVPLSLGASLLAVFQLGDKNPIKIIIAMVSLYGLFIIYLIITHLVDLHSIKKESRDERKILELRYPSIYVDIKDHFNTSDTKANLIFWTGFSLILLLVVITIGTWFFFDLI